MFRTLSTELLRDGYSVRFRPAGQSMSPTIKDSEAVTVEPVMASTVRRGDILLYETARGVVAHRVVKIRVGENADRVFILRGDAANSSAEQIEAGQILGRVISVEREEQTVSLIGQTARLRQRVCLWAAHLKASFRPRGKWEAINE